MRKRTLAREYALQVLYKLDITKDKDLEVVLANFWLMGVEEEVEDSVKVFAAELVKGVICNLAEIDRDISQYATNWKLERMAVVDRNILRLSAYELLFRQEIPPKVSINEAVELAKKYSEPKSAKFVNGVLDKIKIEKEK
ncbi:MAG: transcription antitermination factor NusB [Candidatus Omnitrophota bacterium]